MQADEVFYIVSSWEFQSTLAYPRSSLKFVLLTDYGLPQIDDELQEYLSEARFGVVFYTGNLSLLAIPAIYAP